MTLKFLRCETEQPVDDLLVGTSDHGHAFIQVKHRLTLATAAKSDLGSTIDQLDGWLLMPWMQQGQAQLLKCFAT
ncbi:MAG: hypothetical protein F6K47_30540 [Symploca sp. SIO2E6]|nr:hypothetical protein [Symploca sp. SIO2E6]